MLCLHFFFNIKGNGNKFVSVRYRFGRISELTQQDGRGKKTKTLRDKRDVILLAQTFRQTSPFFLKTGMFVIRPENLMLSDDHDKTRK